ncbi:PepSY domain-containing protein [Sporosarcina sp. 179-K 8C2 HS]|uniref:PepSY domain-containing protein n=1 Tax=Sporosarcina sp. 179-K 8C2 HS TaxID=3142387 RepID=UPI0039A3DADD
MKKWMLIPAMAGVVAVGSVAMAEDSVPSASNKAENMITLKEAKQVATEKVKGGNVTEIELDEDDGRYHFDIDLKDEKFEYDLEVDAYTGEIIKFEKEVVKSSKQAVSGKLLTEKEAIAIAKKKATGTVKEIELDTDDGRKEYDIEMKDAKFKYEIELDAVTGEVLKFEKERHSGANDAEPTKEKQAAKSVDNKTMLTKDQAIAIARQHASGVVTDFELDDNVYEIKMEDGNIEYELDIDAFTGAVLSFEQDED